MATMPTIEISQSEINKWVAKTVPASSTGTTTLAIVNVMGRCKVSPNANGTPAVSLQANKNLVAGQTVYFYADVPTSILLTDFFFEVAYSGGGGGGGGGGQPPASYNFLAPLIESGGNVSIALSQSLAVSNNQLDLNLLQNQDFRKVLVDVGEALRIADYTSVGRVMPQQTHFDLNALNGELRLDVSPTGVLAQTFTSKADLTNLQQRVTQNSTDIARIDNEITDLDNQINLLETGKADVADVYTKQDVNGLLANKADSNDLQALQAKVTTNEGNITANAQSITRIDGEIATINQQITQLDTTKADKGDVYTKNDVYTKTETNGLLANKANTADVVTLAGQQIITGEKAFTTEVRANNLVSEENGAGYGALDIRKADGYLSISQNGAGQAVDILMALGFVDSTNNVRINNRAGGIVTFNTLAGYDKTLTPTDDKHFVPLATLNQVKAELLALIQGSQGGLTFVGEIAHTKDEVTLDPDLLNQFVQATESRAPKKGDFIRTSDSYGFIFNGTDWRNFGQVSVSVATTTNAGIVMLGTAAGELEDIGNGKVRVIGWQTVEQALRDLDARITTNTTGLQTANQGIASNRQEIADVRALVQQAQADILLKANDSEVVKLTGDQDIAGLKKFTTGIKVEKTNPSIELRDSAGNKSTTIQTIDNGENLAFSVGSSSGAVQFNCKLRYPWHAIPTVTADNEIPALKQIKDQFASSTTVQGLVTRIDTNEGNITTLTGRIGAVETLAGQNETAIQGLTPKVTANEQAIQTLTPKVTANEQALQSLSAKVTANEGAIQQNTTDIQGLNTATQQNAQAIQQNAQDIQANTRDIASKADDNAVVKLTGDQIVNGNKEFRGITTLFKTVRMGYGGSTVIISPEDDSTKTLRFRDTGVGTNNKFNLDLENVCGLTGIKDPTSARDAVPRDWANNQYIPKVTTTAINGIQVTSNAQKAFNFDYVWDDTQAGYRNWSGIKLRCKTQSATAFTDMFYLEYRNQDSLGIFMTCVGDKLNFGNPTKLKNVSCEDADSDDTATSKGWIQTNYKKAVIIPVGGSLPTQTASDTIYYIEV